jgi:NitT/TauT family transport system ATP-binding protein
MAEPIQQLRDLLAHARWNAAIELLRRHSPEVASRAVMALPFDQQRLLFRRLPIDSAATLIGQFPYFHAYAVLYSLSAPQIAAIIGAMEPGERYQFLDALPEEAWQTVMRTLEDAHLEPAPAVAKPLEVEEETASAPTPPHVESVPIIEARQIEKYFQQPEGREIQVVAPMDFSIEPNTILALLGPSGSGKSTILRMLSGLLSPSRGEILWHGQPLQGSRPNVAIVFQSFALFPWLSVLENVEAPLLARGMAHAERHPLALKALDSVGLIGFETAYPKELSGGMKQRVGFARALAVDPEVLFMDEPFSALDVLTAENLRRELIGLWSKKKISTRSIFLVTHNIEEAVLMADRIMVLGTNPATIRANFLVPLPQPRDRKSAAYLLYVDYVYKVMTQPQLQLAPPTPEAIGAKPSWQMLPHARPGSIAGLLGLLVDHGGEEDLYHVAEELLLEIDDLLPIVQGATLLGFATADEGDVKITSAGREFVGADISTRKSLFREAALAHVALLQKMKSALDVRADHAMPLEFFHDVLDEHFTETEVEKQLQTALNWGRYAEIFSYDPESGTLRLHKAGDLNVQDVPARE